MGDILFMLVLHLTFICFSSLTRWENNVSCLVSTHTTQTPAHKSGRTWIFLSYTRLTDNQIRYLWTRIYPLCCSVYTVLSLSLKAFRMYRTDSKFSSYFCSFRFHRNILILAAHIQVDTVLPGIATSDFTLLSELVSSSTTVEETFFIYFGRKQWNTFQNSQWNLGYADSDQE